MEKVKLVVEVEVNMSLWSAIKLRIAGIFNAVNDKAFKKASNKIKTRERCKK